MEGMITYAFKYLKYVMNSNRSTFTFLSVKKTFKSTLIQSRKTISHEYFHGGEILIGILIGTACTFRHFSVTVATRGPEAELNKIYKGLRVARMLFNKRDS